MELAYSHGTWVQNPFLFSRSESSIRGMSRDACQPWELQQSSAPGPAQITGYHNLAVCSGPRGKRGGERERERKRERESAVQGNVDTRTQECISQRERGSEPDGGDLFV